MWEVVGNPASEHCLCIVSVVQLYSHGHIGNYTPHVVYV